MPATSSRNSAYSLKTLSRPSSIIQHPSSLADRPPRRTQPQPPATASQEDPSRDAFLPQEVDRYDRIWGDMASRMGDLDSLADVRPTSELALVTEGHARAVEALREKQVLLAETWAGSEERLGNSQSSLLAKLANSAAGYVSRNPWITLLVWFLCVVFVFCVVYGCFYLDIVGSVVNGRIEEAEISDEERARMNDAVFQQMEHEVGIVMTQVPLQEVMAMLTVA